MITGLIQPLEQATSLSLGTAPDMLECYFAVCKTPDSFAVFIRGLIDTSFWRAKRRGAADLPELCVQLARVVDEVASQHVEPAYHSRRHFKEVCLALSLLLRAAHDLPPSGPEPSPWILTDENCWILLLAAIAHDFGHEGRPNRSFGEQEEKACALVTRFKESHPKLGRETMVAIQTLIRSTEPTLFAAHMAVAGQQQSIQTMDAMKVLLVEADLFTSMLPSYGVTLGALLAQEFEPHAPALARLINSSEGRRSFLEAHPYFSPNSRQLGFNDVIRTAIMQT